MPDDDEFASVVLDEDFVRSALFHEPTARERSLAVAEGPALPPGRSGRSRPAPSAVPELDDGSVLSVRRAVRRRPSLPRRQYPLAPAGGLGLAVLMGIGVVALTFAAVYRGAGGGRTPNAPPTTPPVGHQRVAPVVSTPLP